MNAEERLRRRRQLYRLRRDRETPEEAEERRRRNRILQNKICSAKGHNLAAEKAELVCKITNQSHNNNIDLST